MVLVSVNNNNHASGLIQYIQKHLFFMIFTVYNQEYNEAG